MSYDTVRRWKNKFESGVESIKSAPKSGGPKFASRKEIVSKIKEIIERDARFTVRDIARKVGISLSTVQVVYNLVIMKAIDGLSSESNVRLFYKHNTIDYRILWDNTQSDYKGHELNAVTWNSLYCKGISAI